MTGARHWLYAAALEARELYQSVTRTGATLGLAAAFFSAWLLIDALWIPAKAELAQWLIERSWNRTLEGEPDAQPWPWADTRALGVLEVPGHDVRQVFLEGNSGRNLAFGPVLLGSSDGGRDLVLSGHRDTHFRFLQRLEIGDRVQVSTRDGRRDFEVAQIDVVDSLQTELVLEPGLSRLSLVTCFPFDTPRAGGPLRYVVTALPAKTGFRRSPRFPSSG